jgi:hypothetical protein
MKWPNLQAEAKSPGGFAFYPAFQALKSGAVSRRQTDWCHGSETLKNKGYRTETSAPVARHHGVTKACRFDHFPHLQVSPGPAYPIAMIMSSNPSVHEEIAGFAPRFPGCRSDNARRTG